MKTAIYHNNHDVRVEDRPVPELHEGEILVQSKACGVCVSDTMEWYLAPRAPLPRGHEAAGIIVKIGPGVTNFKVGDRVAVHHHIACMRCEHCRKGNFTLCESFKRSNIEPGGFAEYFKASREHVLTSTLLLPDHVSYEAGTLVEPLACVVHAIRKAQVQPGDKVVLIGTGVMGLMFIETLRHWGVDDLLVYEVLDWRMQQALEAGATTVLKPSADPKDEIQRVRKHFGGSLGDKIFIAAKDLRAMELGMQLVQGGGTVVFFATPMPEEWIKLYPSHLFFNEITLTSSYSANHIDIRTALDLISNGVINVEKLITHRYPLEKLSDAILQTVSRDASLKCIVTFE